jgi:subtilase family serine protease
MSRNAIFALLTIFATLGAAPNCNGAYPSIASVVVKGVTASGALNTYHIAGTVTNSGSQPQSNNVLQSVDVYMAGQKLDSKSVPPLAPGQSYTFTYDYQRSKDAGPGSTHLRFQMDMHQPVAAGPSNCNPANGNYMLTL